MSDSFADLWASSAPTKSTPQQPQKKAVSTVLPRRQQYDAFSILSAAQPSCKPVTNLQPSDRQGIQPQSASRGGDAFSDLFTSSLDGATASSRNPDRVNMTMAERAALAQKAKVVQNNAESTRIETVLSPASLWDGLDALGRPTTAGPSPRLTPSIQGKESFDFGLDVATPGEFDFGNREDGPPGDDDSDTEDTFGIRSGRSKHAEDDILGDLGKPVSHSHSSSPIPSTSTRDPVRSSRMNASPPPHITGQLVEMGFSPVDARAALLNTVTENGFDVQAATELLLSQAGQDGSTRASPQPPERERRRNGNRDQVVRRSPPSRVDSHAQPPNLTQSHSQLQAQLDTTAEKLLSQASEIGRGMFSKANALWKEGKERAVKMYEERAATANAVDGGAPPSDGRPRWMRNEGERQRSDRTDRMDGGDAIQGGFRDDEEQSTARQHAPARPPPSQPQPSPAEPEHEREVDLFGVNSPTTVYQSRFRRAKPKPQVPSPSNRSSLSVPASSIHTPSLTSSNPSTSQRRPQSPRTFTATIALSALTTSTSHKSAGTDAYKRGDFPVALAAYLRALSALPSDHILRVPILTNIALVRSKLGELRDAITACEEAIAIVRQLVCDTSGSGSSGGVEMSFGGTESAFDEKTPMEVGTGKVSVSVQGDHGATSNGDLPASVDLVEGLSKAFRRRAEALEGLEKWGMAQRTWEVLLGAEWAGTHVKGDAAKGVGRCRRMVNGDGVGFGSQSVPPKPKPKTNSTHSRPKPKPTPKPSTSPPPSAALTALRDHHNAEEAEDAARLTCKDSVDARLTAWKSGREGNIRALLTSLDETVLWPELGWRKVGMAEVVSKGQVKGAYVRAIAKVHPDKLNAGNTAVEQRMIANGVFGSLNEAWIAFQQQQQ